MRKRWIMVGIVCAVVFPSCEMDIDGRINEAVGECSKHKVDACPAACERLQAPSVCYPTIVEHAYDDGQSVECLIRKEPIDVHVCRLGCETGSKRSCDALKELRYSSWGPNSNPDPTLRH